jgi:hypothetical protein
MTTEVWIMQVIVQGFSFLRFYLRPSPTPFADRRATLVRQFQGSLPTLASRSASPPPSMQRMTGRGDEYRTDLVLGSAIAVANGANGYACMMNH